MTGSGIADFVLFLPSTWVYTIAELFRVECTGTVSCASEASNHWKVLYKNIWLEGKRWGSNKITSMKELSWKTFYKCGVAFWLSLDYNTFHRFLACFEKCQKALLLFTWESWCRGRGKVSREQSQGRNLMNPLPFGSDGLTAIKRSFFLRGTGPYSGH